LAIVIYLALRLLSGSSDSSAQTFLQKNVGGHDLAQK